MGEFPPLFPSKLFAIDAATLAVEEQSFTLVAPESAGHVFHAESIP